jgi:hypothetical protein
VSARAESLRDADLLTLQVADGSDRLVHEQLVAAAVHTGQRRDRLAGVYVRGDKSRDIEVKVDLAAGDAVGP